MYKPHCISPYLDRQAEKLRHAEILLEEAGDWFGRQSDSYRHPHCIEREYSTPEEKEAQDRIGEIGLKLQALSVSVGDLLEELDSVRGKLDSHDWVVMDGHRVSATDTELHERLRAISSRFLTCEISRDEYEKQTAAVVAGSNN